MTMSGTKISGSCGTSTNTNINSGANTNAQQRLSFQGKKGNTNMTMTNVPPTPLMQKWGTGSNSKASFRDSDDEGDALASEDVLEDSGRSLGSSSVSVPDAMGMGQNQSDRSRQCQSDVSVPVPVVLKGHTGAVSKLRAPCKVDSLLLSASTDGTVRLWNCGTAQQALVLTQDDGKGEMSNSKLSTLYVNDACSDIWAGSSGGGSGSSVDSSGSGMIFLWSGLGNGNGKVVRKIPAHTNLTSDRGDNADNIITCMEGLESNGGMGSDSCLVATGSNDRTVKVWDARARKPLVKSFKGHTNGVLCLEWLVNERALVSGSKDKSVRVWDLRTGR